MTKTTLLLSFIIAAMSTSAYAVGDPKKGKSLAYTCTGCHGINEYKNAYPSYHVPKLAVKMMPISLVHSLNIQKVHVIIQP